MKPKWFANRYVATFSPGIEAELTFHRRSTGEEGWDWSIWLDNPDEPLKEGWEATLDGAKSSAAYWAEQNRRKANLHHAAKLPPRKP